MDLAVVDMNLGQYALAEEEALRAKALFEALDLRWDYAYCLNQLGYLAGAQQHYARAETYLRNSMQVAREVNNQWGIASGQNQLGYVYYYQQQWAEAAVALGESLTLCREINDACVGRSRVLNWARFGDRPHRAIGRGPRPFARRVAHRLPHSGEASAGRWPHRLGLS